LDLKRLIPLYIGAAIGPMGGFGIVTVIPVLAATWAVDFSTASLAITFYMAPFIAIQIFSGAIAQLFDVRKTLFFGFALYAVGAELSGLAPDLWTFMLSRIVQGCGAGFLTPVIMASIGELVPEQHVGKAIGMLGVAYTVGVTLGPYFSGVIEVHYGWTAFFHFLAVITLVAGILYAVTSEAGTTKGRGRVRFLGVFPILKQALKEPGVLTISFAAFSLFLAYIGIMTFTADFLKSDLSLPSDKVGALLSVTGFSGIIVSPFAGFLGDRVGRKRVFLMGTAIAILSVVLMTTLTFAFSTYLALFLVLGTGAATAWTSLNTLAVQLSSSLRQPVTSVYNAIKFSGYAAAPILLSFIYNPMRLRAVQIACIVAMIVASFLASMAKQRPSTASVESR
jgi:MFS family permease